MRLYFALDSIRHAPTLYASLLSGHTQAEQWCAIVSCDGARRSKWSFPHFYLKLVVISIRSTGGNEGPTILHLPEFNRIVAIKRFIT